MRLWCRGRGSSSESPQASKRLKLARKVNESLYELARPQGTPIMQVLFLHGLQFHDCSQTHLRTWESGDRSCIWPDEWLNEDFPDAHIFFISYNGNVHREAHSQGNGDMFIITENLISDIMEANIGQTPNCPVIMVGHCFGGMVIKQLCLLADMQVTNRTKLRTFLESVRGIFFYSTPHHGSTMFEKVIDVKHPLWTYFQALSQNAERLNYQFNQLCTVHAEWQIHGLGASLPVQSGQFKGLELVPEPSARVGHSFNVREADHFSICRPESKYSSGYYALKQLLDSCIEGRCTASTTKAMVHGLPYYPTALEKRAVKVQAQLTNAAVVGVVGMGGIGKTSVAKAVFNNISQQFEYTCFVDNVKSIKTHKLKDWILNHFLRNGSKVEQNSMLWGHLKEKKTLIVMDDVDLIQGNQIRNLLEWNQFGNGSRLIITSRYHDVIVKFFANSVIYEVDFLNFDEAKKLFCQHAFQQEGIPDRFVENNGPLEYFIKTVVEMCGGLPLTLEVMGSYLRGQETKAAVWEETIDKLSKAQPIDGVRNDALWAPLRLSYDALSPEEQGMFIEAGILFFEQPVERALAAWSTGYGNSETRWQNLLNASMVKEVYKTEWNGFTEQEMECKEVWVHDQLRDLARELSKGAMMCSLNDSDSNTAVDLLNANAVKADTKILRLLYPYETDVKKPPTLKLEMLNKLEKLKYLQLDGVLQHEGWSKNSLTKLSLLKWNSRASRPSSMCLPPISLQQMKNLAVLELDYWEKPEEVLEALGKLSNLRILSLSYINELDSLPESLGHLSHLKRLELIGLRLETLPHSFGNLWALEHLILVSVDVVELPEAFGNLSSLSTLLIRGCHRLATLPESFGHLSALRELRIYDCRRLEWLQLPKLREFPFVRGNSQLEEVGDLFGNLNSLSYLRLNNLPSLKRLPESFGRLRSLEELVLNSCEILNKLPENIGQLEALKKLTIRAAHSLEALPGSFENLSALEEFDLEDCHKLQRLPDYLWGSGSLHWRNVNRGRRVAGHPGESRAAALTD